VGSANVGEDGTGLLSTGRGGVVQHNMEPRVYAKEEDEQAIVVVAVVVVFVVVVVVVAVLLLFDACFWTERNERGVLGWVNRAWWRNRRGWHRGEGQIVVAWRVTNERQASTRLRYGMFTGRVMTEGRTESDQDE